MSMADLYPGGPNPTRAQLQQAAEERERRDLEARQRRMDHGQACDRLLKLEAVCDSLGAQLARQPDNDATAALFHAALEKLRAIEALELGLRP